MSDINTTVETTQAVESQATTQVTGPIGPVATVSSNPHEELLRVKYPHLNIKPGSLVQAPADRPHEKFANKIRVRVVCPCGVEVERATSDLFTFKGCPICKKAAVKAEKALKKGVAGEKSATETALTQKLAAMEAELAALKAAQTPAHPAQS